MTFSVEAEGLAVGYGGAPVVQELSFRLLPGEILALIGPNGAGKTTVLRSLIRQLPPLEGRAALEGADMARMRQAEIARKLSILMTDRIRPERMTCADVVATGRYPYTGFLGLLDPEDRAKVRSALARVQAEAIANRPFAQVSDGQRQRVMLARALCQEPRVMVLDEPTAYLDIRCRTELLNILQSEAREKGIAVIVSLHEIDVAGKLADKLLCIRGGRVFACGTPEEVFAGGTAQALYDMPPESFDPWVGSVELSRPQGEPRVFVLCGGGQGAPVFRALQKRRIPFAAGILYDNDLDCPPAKALAARTFLAPAFTHPSEALIQEASQALAQCEYVILSGPLHRANRRLLAEAERLGIPVREEIPKNIPPA